MGNVIDTYCCSIPTAHVLSVFGNTPYDDGNLVCFSFQWNIQQVSCEIKIAANAISRVPRAFYVLSTFHVARGILLYTWVIIIEFECDYAFDFMYKFS